MPDFFAAHEAVSIKYVNDLHTENQTSNFTTEYDSSKHIVLRRGNSFEFIVQVSSLADLNKNKVTFELHRGHRARYTRGTMFQGACSIKSKRYYQWDMQVKRNDNFKINEKYMYNVCIYFKDAACLDSYYDYLYNF